MSKLLTASLASLCAVLIGGLVYEAVAPLDTVPAIDFAPRSIALSLPPPLTAPPEAEFELIDAKPIFSPARAPMPDSAEPSAASTALSDMILVGVILSPDKAIALLKSRSTSQTVSTSVGDHVAGWRVRSVEAARVILTSATGTFVIPLNSPTNGVVPNQSALQEPQSLALPPVPAEPQTSPQNAFSPPAVVSAQAGATTPPKPASGQANLPVLTAHGSIAPEALKGAPIDPKTGEPTL